MKNMEPVHLTETELGPYSSRYLREGRKAESWRIESVDIAGARCSARVSMLSTYVSPTDARGFHLTIFSTLEFLSELMIIYGHVWAGLKEKTREGWMVESTAHSVRAIRDPDRIDVEMTVESIRRRGDNLFGVADFRVTDRFNGLFKVRLKGFLS